MTISEKASKVKLLLMDCDGVLTDGQMYFGHTGEELKSFFVRDGQGLVMFHNAGFKSGIISGRSSPIVEMRAGQLGIEYIYQGKKNKADAFHEIAAESGFPAEEIAWIGDDTPDIDVFPHVGFAIAVADAHDAVKAAAHYVTQRDGGRGAVREVIDMIMDSQPSK